jgi:diaminohydroxyphosphoribosylaminopyrimidine deaminase/5-amino-6-(5-phosphoribosylamino)uracil reductase
MRTQSIAPAAQAPGFAGRATAPEERAMRAAAHLARRGIGGTHPNPRVGAVVLRGGETVAVGYHERAGQAHAEVRALEAAGSNASGATLVVTLEPCAHYGRTPPCVDAILSAGIRRVVVGMRDPNPIVNGRGLRLLREAGLDVVEGALEQHCRALNPAYLKFIASGLPWVLVKSMISLDGRMASEGGESRGLGSAAEQRLVHRLRAEHDAILVGIGTVLTDDPELTVRLARGRNPIRVVLDSRLRIPLTSRLVATAGGTPLIVATVTDDRVRASALEGAGAIVWRFEPGPDGLVPVEPVLRRLAREGALAVLVEGGAAVSSACLRAGLVDRVALGIAPVLLGGRRAPVWTQDLGRAGLADGIPVSGLRVRRVGPDLWLTGDLASPGEEHV